MKIAIVCKGSIKIGLGHLFRVRTFSKVAVRKGYDLSIFAVVDDDSKSLLAEFGGKVFSCSSEDSLLKEVKGEYDIVFFDTLDVNDELFSYFRKSGAVIVSLSPIFNKMNSIDVLFTRFASTSDLGRIKVFKGIEYAIFNDNCFAISDSAYKNNLFSERLPIAVCMGGADAQNKTYSVVKALLGIKNPLTIWVLLGEGYSHSYDAFVAEIKKYHNHEVILAKTNASTWRIMSNCALGIMAGGLTAVEAIYAGLPAINVCEQYAHLEMMKEWVDKGYCFEGGIFSDDSLNLLKRVVEDFFNDRNKLLKARELCKSANFDNKGSENVLNSICKYMGRN